MSEADLETWPEQGQNKRVSEFQRFLRVMFGRWLVIFGTFVIVLTVFVALFAPQLAPYNPNKVNLREMIEPPSAKHLLGTDEMGRDLLSRVIYGSRIAVSVGIVVVCIAGVIGMSLGLIAGYFGGWIGTMIMRFMDALMSLPPLVLMLAIAVMLGGGIAKVYVALGIAFMPTYCRLMCGEILSIKENDYVMAANVIGAGHIRVMFSHLVPNAFPPLFVMITLDLGFAILAEASLSFLGIGINPPTATWGAMINSGQQYLLTNPLLSIVPGVAIVLLVLAFNLVGDGLRDALDPRLRGKI
ncbi:MAG: ABC transporter permease [Phycisphaerae bacterium SM23_30]|nr:MAG: ABC transporter permease [Phycisphaerae bacterium SM23_30]